MGEQSLVEVVDVLGVDEAHLQIELGELGLAVLAQILIPEAARELEVAVDPRDHEHLFEELGRLGQSVERAGLEPRGHQKVPGPFRGAPGEHRGFDVEETLPVEEVPDGLFHPVAQAEPLEHRLSTQVEVAVSEPEFLVDRGLRLATPAGVEGKGRGFRRCEDLKRLGEHLDRTAPQPRVYLVLRSGAHLAAHPDHVLGAHLLRLAIGRRIGIDHHLHQPLPVAEVEKDQAPEIPPPVHPALEDHPGSDVLASDGTAVVGSFHSPSTHWPSASRASSCCSPVTRSLTVTVPRARSASPKKQAQRAPRFSASLIPLAGRRGT